MAFSKDYYAKWYPKNKLTLSEKRKARYRSDPLVRQRAIQNSISYRARHKKNPPPGYTITFEQAASLLGITEWILRSWRKRGFYPDPLKMGRCLYFTENQIKLLSRLKDATLSRSRSSKDAAQDAVNLIYANWA